MNFRQSLMSSPIGFTYRWSGLDGLLPPDTRRVIFRAKKVLEGLVYDTVYLEGNPYTFPEVKTLLEGITVGGHRLTDQRQVLNQAESWHVLFDLVQGGRYSLGKDTFLRLHAIVAREEALTWGVFRDGEVTIAGTKYQNGGAEASSLFTASKTSTSAGWSSSCSAPCTSSFSMATNGLRD